jgi:uncharacterized membrane protein
MKRIKEILKTIWEYVWDCFKGSFMAGLTYVIGSTCLLMLTVKEGAKYSEQMTWCVVVIVLALAYNGLLTWNFGATNFEMLVSGNMKRISAEQFGTEYKISSHKYVKEYRAWKGFAIGAFISLFTIIAGIFFGCNQKGIDTQNVSKFTAVMVIVFLLLSGWSIIPFYYYNLAGGSVSYFISIAFAVLPIIVTGVMYIVGAYGKRNKTIKAQELADRAAQAAANKPKKINYGGLPGTKPKKRK